MWTLPTDPTVVRRMRAAHAHARATLGTVIAVHPDAGPAREIWGWRGRTLSRAVACHDGDRWLRVVCAKTGQIPSTFWNGNIDAERSIPQTVPRPRLLRRHDWNDGQWEYRAELFDHVAAEPMAATPQIVAPVDPPSTWWVELRSALTDISAVKTRRLTIQQRYLDRTMPRFLGTPITTKAPARWNTAHGDLHFANLSAPSLVLFDFEGWGLAPSGYDAAMLYCHSLLVPATAQRVREELACQLDNPSGRFAELVVITELLHAAARGDHTDLSEPLRRRASCLLARPIPPIQDRPAPI